MYIVYSAGLPVYGKTLGPLFTAMGVVTDLLYFFILHCSGVLYTHVHVHVHTCMCCVALPCCLFDLACLFLPFFLISHYNMYIYYVTSGAYEPPEAHKLLVTSTVYTCFNER